MSEETQEIKEEQATEAAPEGSAGDAPASEGAGKTKKVNRISAEELNKKIKNLEEANQTHSKYYKHLVQRKNELERGNA